ncbi:glycosyltransferase family 8 protein [Nostoc spongiaeforme FACHB-130]|uniref:Glycosyltransferase family 8 protein n=1 Tax=Nostoc spongiaeforme FACHB-130 TaxID=1357510 RepID=A0ABR8FT23_9NOSO|nr:glycosyltransferase family 8 protein [Nostoc spongiaeforme]MBD2593981.1 glycosyltransferase family 8 protein [Nostoc spongiaeforme FACHB-130]
MIKENSITTDESLISVVCTIDSEYAQHCCVMLTSLFANNPDQHFNIYVITDELSSFKIEKLKQFLSNSGHNFSLLPINKNHLKDAPVSHHVSIAAYFRLLVAEVLPEILTKVLYIDSDIVFRHSIAELWKLDIKELSHAAAIAIGMDDYPEKIDLPKDSLYFNSGLMLINLDYWRKYKIFERGCELIQKNPEKLQWWDQDVLNILLCHTWLPLNLQWNSQVFMDGQEVQISSEYKDRYERFNYRTAKLDPTTVHFIGGGSAKPWHYACKHPFKYEYEKYLQHTPWKGTVPIGQPSLISQIRYRLGVGSKLRHLFQFLTNKPI